MSNGYRSALKVPATPPTGNAVPGDVLSGKTFMNSSGAQTGTMTNRGAVTQTLSYGQQYTIQEGYHNGSGRITAPGKGSVNLSTPLKTGNTGTETYTHSGTSTEALLFTAGGGGTPTVTGSSGVTVTAIAHPAIGYLTPYWYKISGLTNGATVTITWSGGGAPSLGIWASSGVDYT